MYKIERYVNANTSATALLLDIIVNDRLELDRIVVASSMSVYGEGAYACPVHGEVTQGIRSSEQLARQQGIPPAGSAGATGTGSDSGKQAADANLCVCDLEDGSGAPVPLGRRRDDIATVALRFFNTYGPRQALSNPYTGVAAIFSSRLLNGRAPLAFEDGQQLRDFIHVTDVARAVCSALTAEKAPGHAINVGVGDPITVTGVAKALADALDIDTAPEISGTARAGDIRHCYADMTKATDLLGFSPTVQFSDGVRELIDWVSAQTADDMVDQAREELASRGLVR